MKTMPLPHMMAFLFRHTVLYRRSQGALWLTWYLIAIAVLFCPVPIVTGDWKTVMLPLQPLLMVLILWGVQFVSFCRDVYWNRTTGLVPGFRQGVRRAAIAVTLGTALVFGGAGGVLSGHPALAVGTVLFLVSFGSGWVWMGFMVLQFAPKWILASLFHPAAQACVLGFAAWFWWSRLQLAFPASDAAIARMFDLGTQHGKKQTARSANSGKLLSLSILPSVWHALLAERNIRLGRNLAIQVLAGAGHWTFSIAALFVPGLVVAALLAFTEFRLQGTYLVVLQCLLIGSMWLLGISKMQQMTRQLAATAMEQGLLRLAPRIQAGSKLTREIVGGMWKRWVIWWIASTAGVMIAVGPGLATLEDALVMLAFLSSSLVMSALLLRDYSRTFKASEVGSRSFMGMLVLTWALVGAFGAWRVYLGPLSWGVLLIANICATGILLRMRWRALARAPQVFPVCRFS